LLNLAREEEKESNLGVLKDIKFEEKKQVPVQQQKSGELEA